MSDDFFKNLNNGNYLTFFKDTFSIISDASTGIDPDKPVYCGLMMNREQLQTIIDNAHLFGQPMVNAAYLVAKEYDQTRVE
mgnify:CR=1 FL=1